jgi:hypothetical protein
VTAKRMLYRIELASGVKVIKLIFVVTTDEVKYAKALASVNFIQSSLTFVG